MAFLCISLDGSTVDTIHLVDGELFDIDKLTTKYDTAKSLLKQYPQKIAELKNRYNLEDANAEIKVRIFLANDKEQFVMFKKHLIAFKILIKNRKFLKYVVSYDDSIFNKKEKEIINDDAIDNSQSFMMIKRLIENMTEEKYYKMIRQICEHYDNYLEDYEDEKHFTIDEIYKKYLMRLKEGNLSKTGEIFTLKKPKPIVNPFAVFEHPNFFKAYGKSIDNDKPIFILGGSIQQNSKIEYQELYNNCKKCFKNPIYSPLNARVMGDMNPAFAKAYNNSLLVLVNGNEYTSELEQKIKYACIKGITVLIYVKDLEYKKIFEQKFSMYDTVIIKDYVYDNYESQKNFANLAVGIYVNNNKVKSKQSIGV